MRAAILCTVLLATAASARSVTTGPVDDVAFQALIDKPGVTAITLKAGTYHFANPVQVTHALTVTGQSGAQINADGGAFVIPADHGSIGAVAFRSVSITAGGTAILATAADEFDPSSCAAGTGYVSSLEVGSSKIQGGSLGAIAVVGSAGSVNIHDNTLVADDSTSPGGSFVTSGVFLASTTYECNTGSWPPAQFGTGIGSASLTNNVVSATLGFPAFSGGLYASVVPGAEISGNRISNVSDGIVDISLTYNDFLAFENGGVHGQKVQARVSNLHDNSIDNSALGYVGVGSVAGYSNRIRTYAVGITGGTTQNVTGNSVTTIAPPPDLVGNPTVGIAADAFCFQDENYVCTPLTNPLIAANVVSGPNTGIESNNSDVEANLVTLGANAENGIVSTSSTRVTTVADNVVYAANTAGDGSSAGITGVGYVSMLIQNNVINGNFGAGLAALSNDPGSGSVTAKANFIRGGFNYGVFTQSSTIVGNTINLVGGGSATAIQQQDIDGYPSTIKNNILIGFPKQ